MASHIFVSHASEDREVARRIVEALEKHGIKCWVAPRNIRPGSEYAAEIVDAIQQARAVMFVVSNSLNASRQVRREAERAGHQEIPIVPVRIENVELNNTLEYFLSSAHWFDAFPGPIDDHLERLADSIKYLFDPPAGEPTKAVSKAGIPPPIAPATASLSASKRSRQPLIIGAIAAAILLVVAIGIVLLRSGKRETGREEGAATAAPSVASQTSDESPDVCEPGFVWREARPSDHVCVTPESRVLVKQENSRAPQRWTTASYGPHTCIPGYVWREAFQGDDVCVTPERRDQVHEENNAANSRRVSP